MFTNWSELGVYKKKILRDKVTKHAIDQEKRKKTRFQTRKK